MAETDIIARVHQSPLEVDAAAWNQLLARQARLDGTRSHPDGDRP